MIGSFSAIPSICNQRSLHCTALFFIPVTSTEPPENVGVVFVLRVGGDLSEF